MTTDRQYSDIFAAADDTGMNACLNFKTDMSYGYIEGYRHASDLLVEHVAATARDQDTLVYPIAFMYRQHIELQLKQIIGTGRQLLADDASGHPEHHKLQKLWPEVKDILRKVGTGTSDPPEFKRIDDFVKQFSSVDFDSTAFRYPRQKSGSPSLNDVRHVNLRVLAECVHSFSEFLEGAATAIAELLQQKWEQQTES